MSRSVSASRFVVRPYTSSLRTLAVSSQYVSLAQTSGLPIFSQSGYSVTGWFRINNLANAGNNQAIYSEASSSSTSQLFYLACKNAKNSTMAVLVRNDANVAQLNAVLSTTVIQPGVWYHFAWVDNNGVATLYINGVADATNYNYTPAPTYTLNTSSIAGINRSGGPIFTMSGNTARIALYNRLLSLSEITAMYLQGIIPTTPKGLYLLNEGSGTAANDTSGNGNTGSLINIPTWSTDVPTGPPRSVAGARSLAVGRTVI